MAISDISTPKLRVAGFAFVAPAVAILFGSVILLDVRTLGADESLPAAVAVVGMVLAL